MLRVVMRRGGAGAADGGVSVGSGGAVGGLCDGSGGCDGVALAACASAADAPGVSDAEGGATTLTDGCGTGMAEAATPREPAPWPSRG